MSSAIGNCLRAADETVVDFAMIPHELWYISNILRRSPDLIYWAV
jgi:hypothetical protein